VLPGRDADPSPPL